MPTTTSHTATRKGAKAPSDHTKLVRAINRVATAIRRDVRRRTNPAGDFDYSAVLSQLDAATKLMDGVDPLEVKQAVKGLIAAARMLGEAL